MQTDLYFPFGNEIIFSSPWRNLSNAAKDIYLVFLTKINIKNNNYKTYKEFLKNTTNNGKIQFKYSEIKDKFNFSASTIYRSITQLEKNGFIEFSYRGGLYGGGHSLYSISDKWLNN